MTKVGAHLHHIFNVFTGFDGMRTYCKEWDEKLNQYLDEGKIIYRSKTYVRLYLNENIIQVSCCDNIYFDGTLEKLNSERTEAFLGKRPSISTLVKLNKLVYTYDIKRKEDEFKDTMSKL